MIVVIRGTNGSGKSHAIRAILKRARVIKTGLMEGSTLIRLSSVARPILVIGPYRAERSMGGCDCIRRPFKIYDLIDHAIIQEWHVLLEGVVLATRPYIKYHKEGHDVRYAFFDPPIASCLEHIAKRQKKKGYPSTLSRQAMDGKRERARQMYAEAKRVGMITHRFFESPIDATPWILRQLRNEV
jgi:hypothetical protein